MIRALEISSLSVLALVAVGWGSVFTPAAREQAHIQAVDFPSFAVGATHKVQFDPDADIDLVGAYDNESDRQRRYGEQVRDWCLLAVITASNLSAKAVSEATYDLPTVRQESLRRVTSFEYGDLRSRVVSETDVVALVPKADGPARAESLGRIADEQRKNLGEIPGTFHIFEYSLKPDQGYAELTRLPAVRGTELFTAKYGYHEQAIRNRQDLEMFLQQIDDLTAARRDGPVVTLGGRRMLATAHKKIGLEEVATLWRGQQGLAEYQGVGFSLDPRLDLLKVAQTFDSDFAEPLRRFYADASLIEKAHDIVTKPLPKSPQDKVAQVFEFTKAVLEACEKSADQEQCFKALRHSVFENSYQVARYDGHNLAGTEVGMVLFYTDLLMKLWSFDFELSAPRQVPGFPIQPEMRLSPVYRGEVERAPGTRLWLEPLDRGYQITDKRDSIHFARTATRVSARAHDFLAGGDRDFEPNIFERVFIDWWNDHYDEIARYEPQYQRLNEIIKWGVVVAWLDLDRGLNSFAFLSDSAENPIQVRRHHQLPAWTASHDSELTFKNWDKIQFDRPEQARAEFESLALLTSRSIPYFTGPIWFQGGVSLSTRAAVAERAALSGRLGNVAATARRAGVDTRLTNLTSGRLRTLDATTYEFKNYSQQAVSTLARAKPSAKLRDAFGEIENIGFDRTVRRTTDGLLLRTRAEGSAAKLAGELGELRIGRTGDNFRVAWKSRDLDLGYSLARKMSSSPDMANALAANRNIEVTISLRDGQGYLVKVRGSDSWIKLAPARSESQTIAAGYHARVAGAGNEARTIDVAWLDNSAARTELSANGYLRVPPDRMASTGARLECCVRELPEGAVPATIRTSSHNVGAFIDRAGNRYVRTAELPEAVRSDLSALTGYSRRLDPADVHLARSLDQGEFRTAADMLARNPVEYQARLQRIVGEELRFQRTLLEQRQTQIALAHANEAIRAYGVRPEVAAQKAAAEVASGDVEGASAVLNRARGGASQEASAFLQEMEHVMEGAPTNLERANHQRIMDWVRWKSLPERSGDVVTHGRGGQLTLELEVGRLPQGRPLPANELEGVLANRNAALYIQDRPALSNIDLYSTPGRQSLHQMVGNRSITVYELRMNDVSAFRPAALHEATSKQSYHLADAAGNGISTLNRGLNTASRELSNPEPCREDDPREHCRKSVFIVTETRP